MLLFVGKKVEAAVAARAVFLDDCPDWGEWHRVDIDRASFDNEIVYDGKQNHEAREPHTHMQTY